MLFKRVFGLLFLLASLFCLFSCTEDITPLYEIDDDFQAEPSSVYMAVFGDIQYTTNPLFISVYQHSINWIAQKVKEGCHFSCVLHTGDITDNDWESQWMCFQTATRTIANSIPYFSMIGNHDYTWGEGNKIYDRNNTHFNQYVQFPLSLEKVIASFEEGKMENVVIENRINGNRLDILILEFGPREEVVAWADAYVKAHPERDFILMNHEYLEKGGGRRTSKTTAEAQFVDAMIVTPEQLWNNLIKCNNNIRLVLCGHVGGLYALTIDTNDYGREVPQIQHNIQGADYRYDNWLMLWEFPAETDSANVFIYNTKTRKFFDNREILFKFRYRNEFDPD